MADEEGSISAVLLEKAGSGETSRKPSSSGSPSSSSSNVAWLVGDLVWSKIPGHPWWPSMVAYEPNTALYFRVKGRTRFYHVQFFGEDPVRGWISERSIIKFEGKEKFLSLGMVTHGKLHKVTLKQQPSWDHAVKVAEQGVPMNRHERQLCYTFKYDRKDTDKQGCSAGQINTLVNGSGTKSGKNKKSIPNVLGTQQEGALQNLKMEQDLVSGEELKNILEDDLQDFVETKKSAQALKKAKRKISESKAEDLHPSDKKIPLQPVAAKGAKGKKRKQDEVLVEMHKDPPNKKKKQMDKKLEAQINGAENIASSKTYSFPLTPESPQFLNGCVSPTTPEKVHLMPLVNGEISPNTALKLKIRKVKPVEENALPRGRGRPPKKVETFVIVESSVSDTDSYSDSNNKTPSPLSDVFIKTPSPPESNESLSPVEKEMEIDLKVEREVEIKTKTRGRRSKQNTEQSVTKPAPVKRKPEIKKEATSEKDDDAKKGKKE